MPQKKGVRRQSVVSQVFKSRHASFGLITFFALKVIFVDIFIAIGDVSTDFWQVYVNGTIVAFLFLDIKAKYLN